MDFEEWYKILYNGADPSVKRRMYSAWQASRAYELQNIIEDIINNCKTADECRQEIINYNIRLKQFNNES